MVVPPTRKQRRERHAQEVEESQQKLRQNIAETERLLTASDKMLKRHRRECDENDDQAVARHRLVADE